MRVAIGSDHAGFALKGDLCSLLDEMRVEYRDFGTFSDEPVDYPDFIAPVARAVARGDFEFGIVIGGSGTGEAIVANKVRGIRCVQATNPVVARLARELLGGMRAGAAAEVFDGVWGLAGSVLAPEDRVALARRLDLP